MSDTATLGALQRGNGPLAIHGCDCPWEQLTEDRWRTYHAEDCPYLNKIRTSDGQTREIADRVLAGLTIMRDPDDDDDEWLLPDLEAISRAIGALHALVQRSEDRQRFKRALERIGKEWIDGSVQPDDVRAFARSVVAGGSARVPLKASRAGTREDTPARIASH